MYLYIVYTLYIVYLPCVQWWIEGYYVTGNLNQGGSQKFTDCFALSPFITFLYTLTTKLIKKMIQFIIDINNKCQNMSFKL